ncbi:MAG: hypothetical protein WC863_00680 [Patescibacteria group bacterium]
MFDYLQQFNKLAKDLRDRVSSPSVMAMVTELEAKYQVDLAMTIMKVMIKNLALASLPTYFVSEFGLSVDKAESLTKELKEKIFAAAAGHLGLASEIRAFNLDQDINILIKEAGLTLSSEILVHRLKNILSTYIRGVRAKIDTRLSLAKDVKIGGLNLSDIEIDRVLKICDSQKFSSEDDSRYKIAATPAPALASNSLDKIISSADRSAAAVNLAGEYNLKKALASGQVKPLAANRLDLSHELASPAPQLDLPGVTSTPNPTIVKQVVSVSPDVSTKKVTPATPIGPLSLVKRTIPIPPFPSRVIPPVVAVPNPVASSLKAEVVSVAPPLKIGVASSAPRPVVANITPSPAKRPISPPVSGRPQMHDIKPMPKIIGPLEELQFLDLVNFRRLGQNPAEISAKILAKVKLLERDGYDKMILGVKAWRQSLVNRAYLRLGQEALAKGVGLKDYIVSQKQTGKDCLSLEEIEEIVKLNSQLIF